MSEYTFTVGGRVVTAGQLQIENKHSPAASRRPAKAEATEEYHRGWSVEGYPPGQIASAKGVADSAARRWLAMSAEQRDAAVKGGEREPKPFDLAHYLATMKPKKVRSRPYEIPSSAEQCAAMATAHGWEHVRIVEVKKQRVA